MSTFKERATVIILEKCEPGVKVGRTLSAMTQECLCLWGDGKGSYTYIFSVNPFTHTREDGINEIKQMLCWRPKLLSSDVTIDNCLASQLMLCLISEVTLEMKSSFRGKNPADMTHQCYLSEAPAISTPAHQPCLRRSKSRGRQMAMTGGHLVGNFQFLSRNHDPRN